MDYIILAFLISVTTLTIMVFFQLKSQRKLGSELKEIYQTSTNQWAINFKELEENQKNHQYAMLKAYNEFKYEFHQLMDIQNSKALFAQNNMKIDIEKLAQQTFQEAANNMNLQVQKSTNRSLQILQEGQLQLEDSLKKMSIFYEGLVEKKLTQLNQTTQESLNTYLNQEVEEMSIWFENIQEENNHARAIQKLESALNKFPGSDTLIQEYKNRIEPFLESSETAIQKSAIERFNRATRLYLDNCHPSMWNVAKELKDDALSLGNLYMKNRENQFKVNAEKIISALEAAITNTPPTKNQLQQIEYLDEQLEKDILKNYKDLYTRYNKITQRLINHLSKDLDEQSIRDYNLLAVDQFKHAQEKFSSNEAHYKQGNDLHLLTKMLGEWNQTYLSAPSQLYFQNIYADIFSKLNPSAKPKMTKLMLKETKRKVSA